METPPHPFEAEAGLAAAPDPTLRAQALSDALNAIPDFQKWLRRARQQAVQAMHDDEGMSYAVIGEKLGGISRARVQQIIEGRSAGHHSSKAERPTAADRALAADGSSAD